ncbi:YbjQ family protein [Kordiimonas sp.]|uniref:YbjQ family protein n=1 Tax=Kordiimonas sp. TaxID=1970157 RepID=UPI003A8E15E2
MADNLINREGLVSGTRPEIKHDRIIMTSADGFDGYEITEYFGVAWGISVRAKDMGQDCAMGCKNITGGELSAYSAMGHEARQRALDQMLSMASRLRANAVINVKFEVEPVATGSAQVVAIGTAVKIVAIENYVPAGAIGNILAEIHDRIATNKVD